MILTLASFKWREWREAEWTWTSPADIMAPSSQAKNYCYNAQWGSLAKGRSAELKQEVGTVSALFFCLLPIHADWYTHCGGEFGTSCSQTRWKLRKKAVLKISSIFFSSPKPFFFLCLHGHLCLQLFLTGIFQHYDDNLDVYMLSALSVNRQMLLFWAAVAVPPRRCFSSVGSHNISVTHLVVPHFQAVYTFSFSLTLFPSLCEKCLPSLMWCLTARRHFDSD